MSGILLLADHKVLLTLSHDHKDQGEEVEEHIDELKESSPLGATVVSVAAACLEHLGDDAYYVSCKHDPNVVK